MAGNYNSECFFSLENLLTRLDVAIHVENWGWFVQFTPAFIGSGMLVGLNVAWSFFGGSVIAWYERLLFPANLTKFRGIIGPLLVHYKIAFGKQIMPQSAKWREAVI